MMKPVYLVEGKRTPQVKSGADLQDVAAPYLGHYLVRALADKHGIPSDAVDEVIVGCTGNPPRFPNVGRVIALEAGLDKKTSGYTVHRNCASGMEAMSEAYDKISLGRNDIIFAGGVESMSQMPLIYNKEMTGLFISLMKAKSTGAKLKAMASFRPEFLKPIVAIEQGLTDPFCGLNMGSTAEKIARELGISRLEQDTFANRSHQRAVAARERFAEEILPITAGSKLDKVITQDIGPRDNSTVEGLGKMKPYFERNTGTVTVGNACPITDGGAMWLMASEEAVQKYHLKPMARMLDYHFHGLEPERMGLGPVLAIAGVLKRVGMKLSDMELVELNEAFAAQVIGCQRVMRDKTLAAKWGLPDAVGDLSDEILNVNGGGIALGHPVGATGARLVVTLAHELRRRKKKFGLASLCIGGGQGGAVVIENLQ